jgi:hypothetical protein
VSSPARPPSHGERAGTGPADASVGRIVARRPRPAPPRTPRARVAADRAATPAEISALRARLLRFALTLPEVALGDSRLDDAAAGMFVRVARDDGTGVEMREFATLRDQPRWSLSVVVPIEAMVDLQRLGWGRARPSDGPGPLLLELARPRAEADIAPLQGVLAAAHRVAANPQAQPQGLKR